MPQDTPPLAPHNASNKPSEQAPKTSHGVHGSFLNPVSDTKQKTFTRMLMAAAAAGLLASTVLMAKSNNMADAIGAAVGPDIVATAQVLQRCNVQLPELQQATVTQVLEEPASMWLAANKSMPAQAQNELCTQLLSASLQGPSEGDAATTPEFDTALDETKQLMLEQIAAQVLKDDNVADDIAPLMGLTPGDVKHYFKAVNQGTAPSGAGPTPEAGPHFTV